MLKLTVKEHQIYGEKDTVFESISGGIFIFTRCRFRLNIILQPVILKYLTKKI